MLIVCKKLSPNPFELVEIINDNVFYHSIIHMARLNSKPCIIEFALRRKVCKFSSLFQNQTSIFIEGILYVYAFVYV